MSAILASRSAPAITLRVLLYALFWCFLFFPVYWMLVTALRPGGIL